jgi:two-component system sensor histidine kinase DesK
MSLDSEASAGQTILESTGIETEVSIRTGPLEDGVSTTLATVLREGVTNLLRHSKAQRCTIQATVEDGLVRLVLSNDGVVQGAESPGRRGTGLDNLAVRLRELGGTLRIESTPGSGRTGCFTLTAEVPLRPWSAGAAEAAELPAESSA